MTDEPFTTPGLKIPVPQLQPGEQIFAFLRKSDGARMTCELRKHRPPGWEAQFLKGGELFYSRGAFDTRAQAIRDSGNSSANSSRKASDDRR